MEMHIGEDKVVKGTYLEEVGVTGLFEVDVGVGGIFGLYIEWILLVMRWGKAGMQRERERACHGL